VIFNTPCCEKRPQTRLKKQGNNNQKKQLLPSAPFFTAFLVSFFTAATAMAALASCLALALAPGAWHTTGTYLYYILSGI
jgi:hypothetical protein